MDPNILLGPSKPQMTDASKKTLSFGHDHVLPGMSWHMFGTVLRKYHAAIKLIVPAIMVPMNCSGQKEACFRTGLKQENPILTLQEIHVL